MPDIPVNLQSEGPPDTVLPPPNDDVESQYAAALDVPEAERKEAMAAVVASHPRFLAGWASMGDLASDPIESYAYYRVGYHRGLDALRAAGWRGSGYVRWKHPTNRGFLRNLAGLGRMAGVIGEEDEAERIRQFLRQLDPDWKDQSSERA